MIKAIFVAAVGLLSASAQTIKLTKMNISTGSVTVGGLSSGAFMAVQMHVAHSSLIHGAAIYAGGPYYCAMGNLMVAEEKCMYALMPVNVNQLKTFTDAAFSQKKIDDPKLMADDKVFLFSGKKDSLVNPKVVQYAADYYGLYMPKTNIVTDFDLDAQHCIPTLNYGETCNMLKSPYLGKCNHDGAGLALEQLYGEDFTRGVKVAANLKKFDQTSFFSGLHTSIADFGYIYIPTACASGATACKLHMSFHGCSQDYASIGNIYADNAGFNEWAEANNIIVVYPYTVPDKTTGNSNSCWDWWGYTNADYVYQSGVQIKFARDVLDALIGTA